MNVLTGKANREVCNVKILDYATKEPFMEYEYANTTSLNFSSETVYAMAHGARKIAFNDPLEGDFAITAQVVPFKMYALYSDGKIDNDASYYVKETVKATEAGKLSLSNVKGTVTPGTVFVYKTGEFGEAKVEGTFADGVFTATSADNIAAETEYEVNYLLNCTQGVHKITLNNKRIPKAVEIQMESYDKDEFDNIIPLRIRVMKASIQRNLELNFSSEGEPQEITMNFACLEKDADNFVEVIALDDEDVETQG